VRETFLPLAPPNLDDSEIDAVAEVLRSGWITTGPRTAKFEEEFARFIGAEECLALNSCTAALHLALLSLGIGPGDGVITSPLTFAATVNVIEHVGATPILLDVDPGTLTLDSNVLASAISDSGHFQKAGESGKGPRIRAVIPVHYAGHSCDMASILRTSREHGLAVIEDAAHALPARSGDRMIGAGRADVLAHAVCFSFYASKNMTTAEGGMLAGSTELLARARTQSLHGISVDAWKRSDSLRPWYYEIVNPGFKYNMTDVQAAIGLVQLAKLSLFHKRRVQIASSYREAFSALDAIQLPPATNLGDHAWHLFVLRLNLERLSIGRDAFITELGARNIGSSVHFIPIHLHPFYREKYGYEPSDFPIAYGAYERMLSIPIHPAMSDDDVNDVIDAVKSLTKIYRR
jgi:dTDP-4-amino-4,6-dideoxygalactose transaminase